MKNNKFKTEKFIFYLITLIQEEEKENDIET